MNDRFKFRAGFTVSYIDDNEDDREIQLFIKGYFSVDNGGEGIGIHSSIIEEALNNMNLSLNEKKSVVKYLEANYCENDEYWLIDNLDFLEQCTGLKDMNDELIYEGDIVDTYYKGYPTGQRYIYRWESPAFYVEPFEHGKPSERHYFYFACENERCEVIGNIHENPDLLEK